MEKIKKFLVSWWSMIAAIILIFKNSIDIFQVVTGVNIFNLPVSNENTKLIFWITITILLIIQVVIWHRRYNKLLEPSAKLKVKDFGKEEKILYQIVWEDHCSEIKPIKRYVTMTFDTFFVEIFNIRRQGEAKRVWSKIEWINKKGNTVLSHQGRWHIASPNLVRNIEDLQFVDFDSNGHSRKLYFACINKNYQSNILYGLCREMDGKESWNIPKYKLEKGRYTVKITLSGNNGIEQELKYIIGTAKGIFNIRKALTKESEKLPLYGVDEK